MEGAFGGAGAHGQWWNNPNVVKQLTLTDDQRKAMDGIMQDHKMKLIDLQANLEKAEVAMGPMMKADMPDQKAIEAQIDKVVDGARGSGKGECAFSAGHPDAIEAGPVEAIANPAHESDAARGHAWRRPTDGRGGWGQGGQRPGMDGQGGQFRGRGGPGGQFHRPMPGGQPPANAPQIRRLLRQRLRVQEKYSNHSALPGQWRLRQQSRFLRMKMQRKLQLQNGGGREFLLPPFLFRNVCTLRKPGGERSLATVGQSGSRVFNFLLRMR